MPADITMPQLSDTMTEGILVQWLKHEGDPVQRGDVLAEIETDKATMELEAYDSGVLTRIIATPGSTVPIGQAIAVIGDADSVRAQPSEVPAAVAPTVRAPATPTAAPTPPPFTGPVDLGSAVRTSPLARALARKHGLDIGGIRGSGPGGRVVRADVEAAVAAQPGGAAVQPITPRATPSAVIDTDLQDDQQVPLTTIRRITAQRLTESAAAPQFYLTSVADAEPLLTLRTQLNEGHDLENKISVTDLLVRACAIALQGHPQVNSSWAGDHLLRHARINIGIAVALEDGLIVPVIHDAGRKRLSEIATEAHTLAQRARAGKLAPDEFSHGTFTISNLGVFGIDHFTAVINPPEAAILAVGATREEPVVRDGQLMAGTTIKLTLSIDHRVLDGATAAAFLRDLVRLVEQPLRILT